MMSKLMLHRTMITVFEDWCPISKGLLFFFGWFLGCGGFFWLVGVV